MGHEKKGGPPRLRFTHEELAEPVLEKPIRRVEKAAAKLDKAEGKIPTRKRFNIEQATDAKTGKTVARLRFGKSQVEEPDGGKSGAAKETLRKLSSKLIHEADAEPGEVGSEGSASDVSAEAMDSAQSIASSAIHRTEARLRHAQKMAPYRAAAKAEERLDKANVKFLQSEDALAKSRSSKLMEGSHSPSFMDGSQKYTQDAPAPKPFQHTSASVPAPGNPGMATQHHPRGKHKSSQSGTSSSPVSRWQQRRAIRRQYAAMKRQSAAAETGGNAVARFTGNAKERVGQSLRRNKRPLTIAGLIVMMVAMVMNGLSSCSPLVQSGFQAVAMSTYPADEAEMLKAERIYAGFEKDLQDMLNNYERNHDYDEYYYDLYEIWHDPHALMCVLSAYFNGAVWTADQAYDRMVFLFEWQYKLTEDVKRETRYRQEERIGYNTVTDPDTGETKQVPYTYYVDVPYYYYIANIKLVNQNLSYSPVYTMSEEQVGMYAMYKSTLGNYPDLFKWNKYASKLKDYVDYDVPQDVLDENPSFAALIEEAEKYLGYPYVWGGSKPTTSFDCSGFVCWVFTSSGVLNTGRMGAISLYGMCTPVTEEEAQPGDLVFFEGTIPHDDRITHVGIYVGDGMMIHCGDPITYADLSDRYWVQHMYGYARPRI